LGEADSSQVQPQAPQETLPRPTLGLGLGRSLRLAQPQGSTPASTSEGDLCLARPQGSASTSTSEGGLRLARPQGSASTLTSRGIASGGVSASPDLGLGPTTPQEVHHYPTPSQLRLQGNKTGVPSRLAPVTSNDGSPRASMTTVALSPLWKQGDVSKVPTTPTAMLLQGSNAPPTATTPYTQGPSTSPTATLACT
jgi:hypothetical protein